MRVKSTDSTPTSPPFESWPSLGSTPYKDCRPAKFKLLAAAGEYLQGLCAGVKIPRVWVVCRALITGRGGLHGHAPARSCPASAALVGRLRRSDTLSSSGGLLDRWLEQFLTPSDLQH